LRPSATTPQPAAAARPASPTRKDGFGGAPASPPPQTGSDQPAVPGAALKSLRDRLIQRQR
jgi:hypothetical protein